MKTFFALLVLSGFGIGMAGCNTTKGVGQDLQSGGQSIEKSADNHGAQP